MKKLRFSLLSLAVAAALLLPAGMAALGLFFMGLYYARGGAAEAEKEAAV